MNLLTQVTGADLDTISSSISLKFATGKIGPIVGAALPYVFGISGFALAVFIVFSGFSLMMSRGDQKAVQAAQAQLTYAVIGFIVVFTAFWITQIFGRILGINAIINIFG